MICLFTISFFSADDQTETQRKEYRNTDRKRIQRQERRIQRQERRKQKRRREKYTETQTENVYKRRDRMTQRQTYKQKIHTSKIDREIRGQKLKEKILLNGLLTKEGK